jgi:hypothetical protein
MAYSLTTVFNSPDEVRLLTFHIPNPTSISVAYVIPEELSKS